MNKKYNESLQVWKKQGNPILVQCIELISCSYFLFLSFLFHLIPFRKKVFVESDIYCFNRNDNTCWLISSNFYSEFYLGIKRVMVGGVEQVWNENRALAETKRERLNAFPVFLSLSLSETRSSENGVTYGNGTMTAKRWQLAGKSLHLSSERNSLCLMDARFPLLTHSVNVSVLSWGGL